MYYPYFRGKQFELILLRDNAQLLADNNIHPIIEPVKEDFTALTKAIKTLHEKKVASTIIVNPQVGELPSGEALITNGFIEEALKHFKSFSIGYILHADSNLNDLLVLLKKFEKQHFTLIHYGFKEGKLLGDELLKHRNVTRHVFIEGYAQKLYQRHLRKEGIERILVRNGFKPQKKNAHYPFNEHFSDLHMTYPDEGMDGFGDYLIAGDEYKESGGPAYAVAIHLTYLNEDEDMNIFHFISDQTDSPTDPGGKFFEALNKLVKELSKPKTHIYKSSACEEYLSLHKNKHYPGLGSVKKLSMQHHLELVADYLRRAE
jgi:hypothetical protein